MEKRLIGWCQSKQHLYACSNNYCDQLNGCDGKDAHFGLLSVRCDLIKLTVCGVLYILLNFMSRIFLFNILIEKNNSGQNNYYTNRIDLTVLFYPFYRKEFQTRNNTFQSYYLKQTYGEKSAEIYNSISKSRINLFYVYTRVKYTEKKKTTYSSQTHYIVICVS